MTTSAWSAAAPSSTISTGILPAGEPPNERPWRAVRRGHESVGPRRGSLLRRPGGPDRRDASHHRRREEVDRRTAFPAGIELLHPAARPRGAAARHLYRLAARQEARRTGGR